MRFRSGELPLATARPFLVSEFYREFEEYLQKPVSNQKACNSVRQLNYRLFSTVKDEKLWLRLWFCPQHNRHKMPYIGVSLE